MKNKIFLIVAACFLGQAHIRAQVTTVDSLESQYLNWYGKSPETDKILGTGMEKAYQTILQNKTPRKTIIVAVIDGGVDIDHEDLQGRIWTNKNEIPGNNIDDDNNGYIDDIYGWNFLGNSDGQNINDENLEITRLYRKYKDNYDGKSIEGIPEAEKRMFQLYERSKAEYLSQSETYAAKKQKYEAVLKQLTEAEAAIKASLNKEELTLDDVKAINDADTTLTVHKSALVKLYSIGMSEARLNRILKYYGNYLDSYLNLDFSPRAEVIKDDPFNMSDNKYGNNDVKGEDPGHGTMVSGIIGAIRNNGLGVNGVADSVKIMALRTVPNGDEYDKDVALSIRYAVDNGANIINMSFGKSFSPLKGDVDDAVKYAAGKGVLMLKASGNNAEDIDEIIQYPNPFTLDNSTVDPWLTVGANSKDPGKKMTGSFSNYGRHNVDLFAPGVQIISTAPGSKYDQKNGTSFACPVVTGVAALVWSHYPELTASELKSILLKSSVKFGRKQVYLPGYSDDEYEKVKFGKLSKTGGIVSAYNALKMAEKMAGAKEKK